MDSLLPVILVIQKCVILTKYLINTSIEEVLFVIFLIFVSKWVIWKFRNDFKYNNKRIVENRTKK